MASEKLCEEDGFEVHPETLRLWLKAVNLWQPHRKRKLHRSHRERRPRYGALLQLDGSIHAWFSGNDQKQCLMNMVDDATGRTLALMDVGETTRAAFALLRWWIEGAGIPLAIYVDLKSLYVSPKSLRTDEDNELVEPEWLTHFSRACKKLGIEIIKAYSPQAKGRVERNHAVYQDRLVKELRLRKITTIEAANELLSNGFINNLNDKFAKPASDPQDAHVALLAGDDLEQIFCWEYKRQVKNDWTVQFRKQYYQIIKTVPQRVSAKQKITIREHIDESISLWNGAQKLAFHQIDKRNIEEKTGKKTMKPLAEECSKVATENKHKTPWRKFNPQWLKPSKVAEVITL